MNKMKLSFYTDERHQYLIGQGYSYEERVEIELRWQNEQITDDEFIELMNGPGLYPVAVWPFKNFPAPDAISKLAADGIKITRHHIFLLYATLSDWADVSAVDSSVSGIKKETDLIKIADKAISSLSINEGEFRYCTLNGRRREIIKISNLIYFMEILKSSSNEQLRTIEKVRELPIAPSGNNSIDLKFRIYWLVLLAFWKYQLKKDISLSYSDQKKQSGGPLIRFMMIMNQGIEYSENAMSKWINRNKHVVEFFKGDFGDEFFLTDAENSVGIGEI